MTEVPMTRAQERAIDRLERRYGRVEVLRLEDGDVRVALTELERDRERLITPSGIAVEPLT